MASFKNKAYSNTRKGTSVKDNDSYWYHHSQKKKQDKLIEEWLNSTGKKIKLTHKVGRPARNTAVEKLGNNQTRNILRHSPR